MKRKKITAAVMAAMIGISAFPFNAMASSYKEYAKENVTKTIENFCQHYAKTLDRGDSIENSSSIDLIPKISLIDLFMKIEHQKK